MKFCVLILFIVSCGDVTANPAGTGGSSFAGSPGSGGTLSTGGTPTGGFPSTGGAPSSGGVIGTGGRVGSGGATGGTCAHTLCPGSMCVDTDTDSGHCGDCYTICTTSAGYMCVNARCVRATSAGGSGGSGGSNATGTGGTTATGKPNGALCGLNVPAGSDAPADVSSNCQSGACCNTTMTVTQYPGYTCVPSYDSCYNFGLDPKTNNLKHSVPCVVSSDCPSGSGTCQPDPMTGARPSKYDLGVCGF